jgi:hypothetical protein
MTDSLWLSYILFSCPYKLTSKDKLVASYLIFFPKEDGCHTSDNIATVISERSGLAIRTVQKSIGRLVAIGAVSFVTDAHFILEEVK